MNINIYGYIPGIGKPLAVKQQWDNWYEEQCSHCHQRLVMSQGIFAKISLVFYKITAEQCYCGAAYGVEILCEFKVNGHQIFEVRTVNYR